MRRKLLPIIAIAITGLISIAAIVEDAASRDKVQPPFRIVFVSEIEPKSAKASIRPQATKARIAALQKELACDPALTRKLRARGIQIRNVIGCEQALNGVTIIYVR